MTFADVVASALDVDPAHVTDEAGRDSLASWTSMRHIQLIVTLEEAYGLSFDYEEIADARTVRDVRDVLRAKGVEV
ncbi:acyl carrier protein [Lentzea atacamensis]|jgi:acyl carrier protein|uniref:Acyl carrier protein n=2 Tax=Lentzea TaxID=165301 RepID=A0A316ICE1_9PSEU|nr:acyl carrier protein [Lentzea atacamensis]PWK84990.1 acyl carrier protein [Lentzea atacamensis]RAS66000.1 acyl carrier protein [Lentzea atacamensis]